MVRNTVTKNVRHVVPQLRSKYYKRDASLLIQAGTQRGSVVGTGCGTCFLQKADSLKPCPIEEGLRKLGEHVYHPVPVVNHVMPY